MARTKLYVPAGSDAGGEWMAQWVPLGRAPVYNQYTEEVMADNPLAYWRLEDDLTDSSGNGFHLTDDTNNPATFGQGLIGASSAHKSGGGASTHPVFSTITDNLSMEMWFDYDGSSITSTPYYSGDSGSDGYGVRIGNGSSGSGSILQVFLGGVSWNALTTNVTLPTGVSHVVVVRSSGTWRAYVDAAEMATGSTSPNAAPSGNTYVRGQAELQMDEVAFYDSVLSQARIQAHYDARAG